MTKETRTKFAKAYLAKKINLDHPYVKEYLKECKEVAEPEVKEDEPKKTKSKKVKHGV